MTDTLFAEPKVERVDWMNEVARKRYGMPERWRWFISEVKNHNLPSAFIMLTGAVCDVKYERGKRKGHDNWKMRDKAKKAAPSDTMFDAMLNDYRKALAAGREAFPSTERGGVS